MTSKKRRQGSPTAVKVSKLVFDQSAQKLEDRLVVLDRQTES